MSFLSSSAIALSLCGVLLTTGCEHLSRNASPEALASPREEAAFLLPAEALSATFVLRQAVTVRWTGEGGESEEASFDAAVQRQGDALLLLGLGPMGRVGFTLQLQGEKVSFENRTGQVLPFSPERMLTDVQRVYYPWLPAEGACADCRRTGERAGYSIEEHWTAGRLVRRRFEPVSIPSAGSVQANERGIEIVYSGDIAFDGVPRDARLQHEAWGYAVELKTFGMDWIE